MVYGPRLGNNLCHLAYALSSSASPSSMRCHAVPLILCVHVVVPYCYVRNLKCIDTWESWPRRSFTCRQLCCCQNSYDIVGGRKHCDLFSMYSSTPLKWNIFICMSNNVIIPFISIYVCLSIFLSKFITSEPTLLATVRLSNAEDIASVIPFRNSIFRFSSLIFIYPF